MLNPRLLSISLFILVASLSAIAGPFDGVVGDQWLLRLGTPADMDKIELEATQAKSNKVRLFALIEGMVEPTVYRCDEGLVISYKKSSSGMVLSGVQFIGGEVIKQGKDWCSLYESTLPLRLKFGMSKDDVQAEIGGFDNEGTDENTGQDYGIIMELTGVSPLKLECYFADSKLISFKVSCSPDDWNPHKEEYLQKLKDGYSKYVINYLIQERLLGELPVSAHEIYDLFKAGKVPDQDGEGFDRYAMPWKIGESFNLGIKTEGEDTYYYCYWSRFQYNRAGIKEQFKKRLIDAVHDFLPLEFKLIETENKVTFVHKTEVKPFNGYRRYPYIDLVWKDDGTFGINIHATRLPKDYITEFDKNFFYFVGEEEKDLTDFYKYVGYIGGEQDNGFHISRYPKARYSIVTHHNKFYPEIGVAFLEEFHTLTGIEFNNGYYKDGANKFEGKLPLGYSFDPKVLDMKYRDALFKKKTSYEDYEVITIALSSVGFTCLQLDAYKKDGVIELIAVEVTEGSMGDCFEKWQTKKKKLKPISF